MITTRLLEQYYKSLHEDILQLQEIAEKARKKGYSHHKTIPTPITLGFHDRLKNVQEFQNILDQLTDFPLNDGNFLNELLLRAVKWLHRDFGTKERMEALVIVMELMLTILTRSMVLPGFEHRFQLSIDYARQHLKITPNLLLMSVPKFHVAMIIFILDYFRKQLLLEPFRTTDSYVKNVLALMKRYLPPYWIEHLSEQRIVFLLRKIDIELELPDERSVNSPGMWFRLMESLLVLYYILEAIAEHAPRLYQWLQAVDGHDDWNWLNDDSLALKREVPEYPFFLSETAMVQKTIIENSPLFRVNLTFQPVLGRTDFMDARSVGVHPATLWLLPHAGLGTHFILKFPQNAVIARAVPTLLVKGPLIELKDGTVRRAPDDWNELHQLTSQIKHVHSWGELLIPLGLIDANNVHDIRPNAIDIQTWMNLAQLRFIEQESQDEELQDFIAKGAAHSTELDEDMAIRLSKSFKLYLPPMFHLYWDQLTVEETSMLFQKARVISNGKNDEKLVIYWPHSDDIKSMLIKIGASFKHSERRDNNGISSTIIELERPKKVFFELIKAFREVSDDNTSTLDTQAQEARTSNELITALSSLHFFPSRSSLISAAFIPSGHVFQAPPSIGAHGLFPIDGDASQSRDFYQRVNEDRELRLRLPIFSCPSCHQLSWEMWCHKCDQPAIQVKTCQNGHLKPLNATKCPECGSITLYRKEQVISIPEFLQSLETRLHARPSSFLGVRKITNPPGLVEPPEKGFLRAKHDLTVARDGLIHVPAHFMTVTRLPLQLLTEQSLEHLPRLGYVLPSEMKMPRHHENNEVNGNEEWLELFPSDIIIPESIGQALLDICHFLNDWLTYLNIDPPECLKVDSVEDLIGHYVMFLPHAGHVASCARIVGITRHVPTVMMPPSLASTLLQNATVNVVHVVHVLDHFLNFSPELLNMNEHGIQGMPLIVDLLEPYSLQFLRMNRLLVDHRGLVETTSHKRAGLSPMIVKELLASTVRWEVVTTLAGMTSLRKDPNELVFGSFAPLKENITMLTSWFVALSRKTMDDERLLQNALDQGPLLLACLLELATLEPHPQEVLTPVIESFIDELTIAARITVTKYLDHSVACTTCGKKYRRDLFTSRCPRCQQSWQPRHVISEHTREIWDALKQLINGLLIPLPSSLQLLLHFIPTKNEDDAQ